jgi:hypothetical protein
MVTILSPSGVLAEDIRSNSIPAGPPSVSYNDVSWKPSGDFGLQVGTQGTVVAFNGSSSENVGSGVNFSLCRVAWRPDGSYALIVGEGGTILKFIDIRTVMEPIQSNTDVNLTSISWKPDGSYALIAGSEGVMIRFDHDTQRCLRIATNTFGLLGDISWDKSGQHASIRTDNGTSILYPPELSEMPIVSVIEPADMATISGAFVVRGTSSVEGGTILGVEVRLDYGPWVTASGTDSWELGLDASCTPNGHHEICARTWSSGGDHAIARIRIIVANAVLPPLIGFSTPADGAALTGTVVVSGTASASYGPVERVDFRLDDSGWGAVVGTESWKVTLDTTTLPNGVHRMQARVWDGRSYSAAVCTVTVGNEPMSPSTHTAVSDGTTSKEQKKDVDFELIPQGAAPEGPHIPSSTPDGSGDLQPAVGAPVGRTSDGGTISVPMASGGILLLAALAFATEHGKYALFQFLFVPLYSRIKKDRVLDNFTRGMIFGFIMSNPGVHYNFIKQKLGLNNGSIVYHLTVLERQELIKSEKVGLYKRFYPLNGNLSETGLMELNDVQEKLLELVRSKPGLTQRDIGEMMGLSGRLINYHVGLLQRSRLLTMIKEGKVTRCYATERMPVC